MTLINIFINYSEQDWLDLLILFISQHNTVQHLILITSDKDVFKTNKTFKKIEKFYPQQYEILNQKSIFLINTQPIDLIPYNQQQNVLIKDNYKEVNYLQQYDKVQKVSAMYKEVNEFLNKQGKFFKKIIKINNIYNQQINLEEQERQEEKGWIDIYTGFICPSVEYPVAGWIQKNSYFSQLVLGIGEEIVKGVPRKEQKMFQLIPADILAKTVSSMLDSLLQQDKDVYLLSDVQQIDLLTVFKSIQRFFFTYRGLQLNTTGQISQVRDKVMIGVNRLQLTVNNILGAFSHHQKMKLAQQQFLLQNSLRIKQDLLVLQKYEQYITQLIDNPVKGHYQIELQQVDLQLYLKTSVQGIYQNILNIGRSEIGQGIDETMLNQVEPQNDSYFGDIKWVMARGEYKKVPGRQTYIDKVLSSSRIKEMLLDLTNKKQDQSHNVSSSGIDVQLLKESRQTMMVMFADMDYRRLKAFAYVMHKIFKNLYTSIKINSSQMNQFKQLARDNPNTPIVIIPTHRSYVDFLLMSYVLFAEQQTVPHIVSGDDFLKMKGVAGLLRNSGAFFIKRKELQSDPLYKQILKEYIQQLLLNNQWVEFFIEGTRSRTGKMLQPKFGILQMVMELILDGKIDDIIIQPVTINYERVLEAETFPMELLGEQKVKESVSRLVKSVKTLTMNFGQIHLEFAQPLRLKERLKAFRKDNNNIIESNKNQDRLFIQQTGYEIVNRLFNNLVILSTNLLSTIVLNQTIGLSIPELHIQILDLKKFLEKRKCRIFYEGIQDLYQALKHLEFLIIKKKDSFTMWISPKRDYTNNILLSLYRAPVQQILLDEAIIVITLKYMNKQYQDIYQVSLQLLFQKVQFLFGIFKNEVRHFENFKDLKGFSELVERIKHNGIIEGDLGIVKVNFGEKESEIKYLQAVTLSLVEGVWAFVAGIQMIEIPIIQDILLKKIQFITEQFQIQRDIESIESCSIETLKIGETYLKNNGILFIKKNQVQINEAKKLDLIEKKLFKYKQLLLSNKARKLKSNL